MNPLTEPLLFDLLMLGRSVSLVVSTNNQNGDTSIIAPRVDPTCFVVFADGRPGIDHADGCGCDRPWAPKGAQPVAAPMTAEVGPTEVVLAALGLVRRQTGEPPMRVTSLRVAMLADALLKLGVVFPPAGPAQTEGSTRCPTG